MTLIEKINTDFMEAFKAKNMDKKTFLGLVKTEATKDSKEPSDADVVKVLKKFEKSLLSIIEGNQTKDFPPQDWTTQDELYIVQSYLPKQMSEEEIDAKIKEVVECGADNIGAIMGAFQGLEVDRKIVSQKAKQILN